MSCVLLSFLKLTKSSKVFKQNWNDVATLLFHKFTTHDETYLRRLLEGPLHMEITLIPDLRTISLNKICNKYSIYNCYLGIYKQRKCQMRKKEKMNALHCMIINWLKKCHSWLHNCNIMCTSCTWMHSKELPAICSICPCLCSFIRTMFISHVIILWMFFELKIHSSSSSIFGCKIFLWS